MVLTINPKGGSHDYATGFPCGGRRDGRIDDL
jgi:hypothetical protein